MKADPVIKELWDVKNGLSEEHGHDVRRLYERLKSSQKELGFYLVNRSKKPLLAAESGRQDYAAKKR